MSGHRLVSDFLTDQKVPLPEKRRQLLVVNADGQIIWVVGRRPAAPFCVSEHTTETLLIEKQD
jgi:tRNA(Ile)-lysidine synthase